MFEMTSFVFCELIRSIMYKVRYQIATMLLRAKTCFVSLLLHLELLDTVLPVVWIVAQALSRHYSKGNLR